MSTEPGQRDGPTDAALYQRLDRSPPYPHAPCDYIRRLAWEWVQGTLIRLSPRRAYRWRRLWLGLFGARLGRRSSIRPTTRVLHPWLLTMGENSILSDGVVVYNLGAVRIGSHSVVSQDAYLCAGTHDYTRLDFPLLKPPIQIGSGVWVCAGAFVGPGVSIGDNAVVGARAVVVGDVPPATVVAGNPARVVKQRPRPSPGL